MHDHAVHASVSFIGVSLVGYFYVVGDGEGASCYAVEDAGNWNRVRPLEGSTWGCMDREGIPE